MAPYQKNCLLIGFIIWFLATLLFRVAGQYFFLAERLLLLAVIWIVTSIALFSISWKVLNQFKLQKAKAVEGAVWLVLPGMFADAFVIQFFSFVFPNLSESTAAPFGAWLMWSYTVVLLTGVVRMLLHNNS